MMKKSGTIALTTLYLITVIGFALNLHYCFNQITSVNINSPVKGCAMLAGCKTNCCHNQHFQVKVNDAHEGKPLCFLSQIFGFKLPKTFDNAFSAYALTALDVNKYYGDHPDPPGTHPPVYLKNCVFRI